MIIEETVYLEHFGVKGMHWGKRKSSSTQNSVKTSRKKKIAVAAGAATLAAGSIAVGLMLKKHGASKTKTLSPLFSAKGKDWLIESNDGRIFDIAMREMTKQRLGI